MVLRLPPISRPSTRPEPTEISRLGWHCLARVWFSQSSRSSLHFAGVGDNGLLAHEDWQLFGLAREDVLEEIRRLSLKGRLIVQSAGDLIRISWRQPNMEALCHVLAQG